MRREFLNSEVKPIDAGGPNTIVSTMDVDDLPGHIRDVNVTIDIDHTWTNDLRIRLESPNGTEVLLVAGEGGRGRQLSTDDVR